ncbi:baeRF2 domain-containing protein [Streptomyces sp. 7N604]|uniref:baeRF2 domain-containing protein n=1 Tax=Streptomyces sp. 7N604 TaxID=3457415 RepID=UPI003FD10CDB
MELGFLKPLFDRPGPWASVYIDTTRATEDAPAQQRLRERAIAGQLIDTGADAYTTRAVMKRLADEPVAGSPPGRALFAAGAEVVLDIPLARSPIVGEATWSTLPHIAPLPGLVDDLPPCLVAYVDRTGADLEFRDAYRREPVGRAEGREWRNHRSLPEDRYEWHYRNKTENIWNENAEFIAAEIARRWPESGAEVLVLVGDPRERRAVHNELPEQVQAVAVEVERGNRSSADGQLDRRIAEVREKQARTRLEGALERFRIGRGRPGEHRAGPVDTGPGEAAEGVPAVVNAARSHQVATLLLAQAASDAGRDVWIGPEPDQIAVQRSETQAMGVAKPERARADDALMRSAAVADAELLLVPEGMPGPAGGLGAVLRWTF